MKLRNFFIAAVVGLFGLAACEGVEQDLGVAKISIDQLELSFPKEESSLTVNLTATRDWSVSVNTLPEWIGLSATEGKASAKEQTITVTVDKNDGNDREAAIVFNAGMVRATLTVKQAGEKGEYVVPTVTIAEFIKTDGQTEYIISGKVTNVSTDYQYAYINDGTAEVEVYKPSNWGDYVDKIKKGATMTAQGVYTLYTSSSGKSYDELVGVILSVEEGDTPSEGTAKGDGSLDNPYNPAGAAAYAQSLGADVQSDKSVYIKGKISNVSTTFDASGTYGNATFYIVDATDGTGEFYIFQTLYLGNRKFATGDTDVKAGDEVIVYGPVVNYKGNTPETVGKGASYLYSLNGQTGGNDQPDPTPGDPKGTGTQADPYNAAAANDAASALEAGAKSDVVYVSGKISSVKYQFDADHGTATFNISDDGTTSGSQFTCYSVLYLENKAWVSGYSEVKVGDAVVICGKLTNYQGNTPETASKEAYIYSLNGVTEAGEPTPGDDPTTGDDTTYASNVTWTLGSNAYDNVNSTVNGVTGVKTLKLGTSSKYGDATLKIPAGATKLTFYAVSWNNADAATLVFSVDGTEIGKANPVANSGLKGNSTYELTVTDSDKFEIAVTGGTDVKVETNGGYRAALFAINAE